MRGTVTVHISVNGNEERADRNNNSVWCLLKQQEANQGKSGQKQQFGESLYTFR